MKPKVSIIVPAYNTGQYISGCLQSLVGQTLREIEIIAVNDGSTDDTLEIIESFARKDDRIKVINQNNLKQGAARNNGMKAASGEYMSFVDSDDWVDTDFCEKLYTLAIRYDADIAAANLLKHKGRRCRRNIFYRNVSQAVSLPEKIRIGLDRKQRFFNVTNKIFRTTFLQTNNLTFPEGCYFEDVMFMAKATCYANKVVSCPDTTYHYVKNPSSTTKSPLDADKKALDHINVFSELQKFAKENDIILPERLNYFSSYYKMPLLKVYKGVFKTKYMLFGILPLWSNDNFLNSNFHLVKSKIKTSNNTTMLNPIDIEYVKNDEFKHNAIKVSVIVPVYNVEIYLRNCMNSLIKQTLKEIEIICINDGSTDNSLKILEEYAATDSRIKIISQRNQGISIARNIGIKKATGEYLGFVDSDDWVDENFFEKLYYSAVKNNCEIACAGYKKCKKNRRRIKKFYKSKCICTTINEKVRLDRIADDNYVWNKIYKRDIWLQNNISFPPGRFFEDIAIVIKILNIMGKMITVPGTYYNYRNNPNSTVHTKSPKHKDDYLWAIEEQRSYAKENNITIDYSHQVQKKVYIKLWGIILIKIYYHEKLIRCKLLGFIPFITINER